jgi:hypothetical protein
MNVLKKIKAILPKGQSRRVTRLTDEKIIETSGDSNIGIPVVFQYEYLLSASYNKRKRTKILSDKIHAMLHT